MQRSLVVIDGNFGGNWPQSMEVTVMALTDTAKSRRWQYAAKQAPFGDGDANAIRGHYVATPAA